MKKVGIINRIGCVFIIIALLLITYASVKFYNSTSRVLFYHRLEDRINESAKEFYADNKDEFKNGYSSVSIDRLVIDKYIKEPIDNDGNNSCVGRTYIYEEEGEYKYQSCITCGDFKNRYVSDSKYCVGNVDDVLFIEATSSNGKEYNSLLSYDNGEYINGEYVNFNFYINDDQLDKYIISGNDKEIECNNVYNKSCSINLNQSGSYTVYAVNFDGNIFSKKNFSLKLDNNGPKFNLDNVSEYMSYSYDDEYYEYSNKILDLNDNVGIKSISYTLNGVTKNIDKDLTIKENLKSGIYKITFSATDYAGNVYNISINEMKVYKNIKMVYPDGNTEFLSVITGEKYDYLPEGYDWYLDSKGVALITNNTKVKDGNGYTIYGFSK